MSSSFGTSLRVQIFGQSHSAAIGCVIEGIPAGFTVDTDELQRFMDRRAPGKNRWSTPRKEADAPQIVSGLNEHGQTCGTPLAVIIQNTNTRSGDYDELKRIPRPGHADYAAWAKWHGCQDVFGGGHFSARLTAPLCVAGGVALQILATRGVRIAAHVAQVGSEHDEPFCAQSTSIASTQELLRQIDALQNGQPKGLFPTIDSSAGERMKNLIDLTLSISGRVLLYVITTSYPLFLNNSAQAFPLLACGAHRTTTRTKFGMDPPFPKPTMPAERWAEYQRVRRCSLRLR